MYASAVIHPTQPEPSDAEFVSAAVGGYERAFAPLVRRHAAAQLRVAVRLIGCRDDAHDALQSALVRAHRHLARWGKHAVPPHSAVPARSA